MNINENDFFKSQTDSSRIKANIVAEYFPKYCKILMKYPQNKLIYLDLFSGPGIYEDGSFSTPMLIGKACAEDAQLSQKVHLLFNDKEYDEKLKENFTKQFPEGTFKFSPKFANRIVGEDIPINNFLTRKYETEKNPNPTLLFFDPFGYKGINTKILAEFLGKWGNEIFLFFNIKRIHAAIENSKFDELMIELFPTTFNELRINRKYKSTNVQERLSLIIDNLAKEFKNIVTSNLYHIAFRFQEEDSNATSHYIIHFTKHERGYDLVKQIYHDFDNYGATLNNEGDYTFDAKRLDLNTASLLDFGDLNIENLRSELKLKYSGKRISAFNLFNEHQASGKYCRSHYAQTLRKMVELGDICSTYEDGKSHSVSVLINENCLLEFK